MFFGVRLALLNNVVLVSYSSTDQRLQLDAPALQKAQLILTALISIGTRGGYFKWSDMHEAVDAAIDKLFVRAGQNVDMAIDMLAYTLRVMCRHVRCIADTCGCRDTPELSSLFALLPSQPHSSRVQSHSCCALAIS